MARMCRMGAARAYGPKVWKTLMSIDAAGTRRKGPADLNVQRLLRRVRGTGPRTTGTGARVFFGALRGTGPRTTGCVFSVVRACPPRSLPHPGHPDNPGPPASDDNY